ncbi:MAG: putative glycoside hydrolase [Clostridium sp.]
MRPWLQDFTASWLKNHIPDGGEQARDQIRAVYDCGYDEWLLWDAACTYDWEGLLTPEAADAED